MSKSKFVLYNLIVLIALLLVAELIVRVFFSENKSFDDRREENVLYSPSGFTRKWMNEEQVVYLSKDGMSDKQKVLFRINRQGFRDTEDIQPRDSGEVRIAILGGSHVFDLNSYNYENNLGFPEVLESALKKENVACRVINAGEPGAQVLDFPAKILYSLSKYGIDYVVINSEWNDIKWINEYTDSTQLNKTIPQALQKNPMIEKVNGWDELLGWSVIYRKVRDYYWKGKLHIGELKGINEGAVSNKARHTSDFSPGLAQYHLNIIAAVKLIEAMGAKPVLAIEERLVSANNSDSEKKLIQYVVAGVESHDELVYLYKSCDSILKTVASEHNIPLIDAGGVVSGSLQYFADHVHTTPEGSRKLGELYARFFLDSILHQQSNLN